MYEQYYRLNNKPFQTNPDPAFYFDSRQHNRAMSYLKYGLHRNEGFIVITGEVGAGKTTLVKNLLKELDQEKIIFAHLVSTQLDAENALRLVASAFGVPCNSMGKADLILALERFLTMVYRAGKRCILVVDEAQNLSMQAVEELRMLSNFQVETYALLQSFLIGQPEFRYTLQSPEMTQLRQRVIAACHIGPLELEETKLYVEHRLRCVGWKNFPSFSAGAYLAIYKRSGGIPRRINAICDRLLLSGFLAKRDNFTTVDVREVAQELEDETVAPPLNKQPHDEEATNLPTLESLTYDGFELRLSHLETRLSGIEAALNRLTQNNSNILAVLEKLLKLPTQMSANANQKSTDNPKLASARSPDSDVVTLKKSIRCDGKGSVGQ